MPVVEAVLSSFERHLTEEAGRERENRRGTTPAADMPIRSADLLPLPLPEDFSFAASVPAGSLIPENSFSAPAYEGPGGTSRDDRIPELLERLLNAAERSAAFSEQIADLMERQSSEPAPAYV